MKKKWKLNLNEGEMNGNGRTRLKKINEKKKILKKDNERNWEENKLYEENWKIDQMKICKTAIKK